MLIYYTDINECFIDNGGCEFSCINLEGINNTTGLGYQCGCDKGYQLAPNNHDCNGMCMFVCAVSVLVYVHVRVVCLCV